MADDIGQALRREVRIRANERCEYCLIPETFLLAGCEVDHVISRKHGGLTELANLALCCARCNRAKGTDIGSLDPTNGEFVRLFNPRTDNWSEHFAFDGARIVGRTSAGHATVRLLRLNSPDRILEREILQKIGKY